MPADGMRAAAKMSSRGASARPNGAASGRTLHHYRAPSNAHSPCVIQDERGRKAAAKLLTPYEARRIAANIAKLPVLLHRLQY
jgi:hypothetical protein